MRSRLRLAASPLLAFATYAGAQTYHDTSGTVPTPVVPLVGCSLNGPCAGPISATNPLPVSGAFSASLSGFTPGSAYASPLSVATTSSRVALPSGQVVVVYNVGAIAAFVQLGGAAVIATPSNDVVQPNSWMAFSVGTNGFLAAVTTSGSTTLNLSGGSGLPTGSGGGGAGGGTSIATGTAGSPSTAVVTIQGSTGGTPAPVAVSSLPSLPTGANTIGAISNTSFAISGTLPGFAATPTVNAAESGAWNIANISGTITLPTGAATAANQPTAAAQASTTSGQTGALVQAAATTGAPSYTTGTTNPLSTDTNGNLRVTGSFAVSGFDSGIVRVAATPSSSAHAAGAAVGSLFSVPLARVNGGSGIISGIHAWTSWGSTATYVLRLWQKNPTGTSCTDGSAFVGSATDDAYLLTGPQALQFNAPLNTTGDAKSYADLLALSIDYKNADGTTTQNVYGCLVTNASDTPGASATLSLGLAGPQN